MKPEEYDELKRGYACVDLDAISHNIDGMRGNLPPDTPMLLVIKTDGYGHGAVPIALMAEHMKHIRGYAVACPEEAYELRDAGVAKPILILGYTFPYAYEEMIRHDIRPAVFREDTLTELDEAAARVGKKARIHIKVDTGMSRIGIRCDDQGLEFVRLASTYQNIEIEGLFTHFARADEADKQYADRQFERFKTFADRTEEELGLKIPCIHCANSATAVEMPDKALDMVRAGITIYGLWPSDEVDRDRIELEPAMSLISHIVYVKDVEPGVQISYGGTYETDSKRRIATVPVGYGDGYPRLMSNRGYVLIRGQRAPIRGRVCMDQFMVDVTGIDGVCEGDKVTLIGRDGDEAITMEEIGGISGRFNYELACDIGRRIPRVYVRDGEVTDIILDTHTRK